MCSKKPGLPILLVSYEVSPEAASAPKLGGSFKEPPIPLGATAHYTLRLLPPGFAYLYNPADKLYPWQGFLITQDSYLYPFRIDRNGPEYTWSNADLTPCKPNEHGAIAQAITIPRAEEAGDVWVCYSSVQWTKETWQRFNDNTDGCRDKVMQKFNVAGWLANPKQDHAALISEMAGKIVEFSDVVKAKEFNFSANPLQRRAWSLQDWGTIAEKIGAPAPKDPMAPTQEEAAIIAKKLAGMTTREQEALFKSARFGSWDILVEKFKRLCAGSGKTAGKGLVLALRDAVGVTSDLSTLVTHASKRFAEHLVEQEKQNKQEPGLYRKLMTSQAIEGVREMVCARAIRIEQRAAEAQKAQALGTVYRNVETWQLSMNPDIHDAFSLDPEDYERIADKAWKDYKGFYNENDIKAFKEKYANELASWNDSEIASLSDAHAKWLDSAQLAATMQYCFDAAHIDSGRAYARAVALCLGSGQETAEVRQVIEKWLNGEVTNPQNLYLRALVFNQDGAAKAAAQFIGQINGKPFYEQLGFWKDFLDNGFKVIEDALQKDDSVIHMLLTQGSGVIMEAMQEASRTANAAASSVKHWAVILGGISGKALGFMRGCCSSPKGLLNFVGNRIYYSLYSTKTLQQMMTDTIFQRDMLGDAHMQPVQGGSSIETNIMVAVDKGKISANMGDAEVDKVFGHPMRGEPSLSHKRPLLGIDREFFSHHGNVAVAGGLVSFFLNLAVAGSALKAYQDGGKHHPEIQAEFAQNELTARFGVAIIGCVASFADATSAVMQRAIPPARLAQGMGFRLNVSLKLVAKGGGAVASGVVAYRDFLGVKEARDQKKGKGLIVASIALATVDFAIFTIALYSFATYIIALFQYVRAGVAIAEVTSITVGGLEIPIVNALVVLFVAGLMFTTWRDNEKLKASLKEWLSRSAFGKGEKPMYSSLAIEQSALKAAFQQ